MALSSIRGGKAMKIKRPGMYYIIILIVLIVFPVLLMNRLFDKDTPTGEINGAREDIEIRFLSSWGGTDTKAQQVQRLLEEFENNNPGVKIVNESMSGAEFLFKLKTNFAQGNDPDVFGLWPGSDIKMLIKQGKVADITDLLMSEQ